MANEPTAPRARTTTGTMTRRTAVGLAVAAALPWAMDSPRSLDAAEPVPGTWMASGNAARTGAFPGPGLDLSREIVELWRIDGSQDGVILDACGVCDGIVYYRAVPFGVSADITPLVAVDAQTGTELWRKDPPITDPPTSFWGQPAIADGLIVIPTYSGLLVGIDAKTGDERWIFALGGQTTDSRVAVVDGVAYVSDTASVNAVAVGDTAEWLWKTSLGDGAATVVSGTVSVDGDMVVVSSVKPAPESEFEETATDIHVLDRATGAESYRSQFRSVGESYQFALQDGMIYSRIDKAYMGRSFIYAMSIDGVEQWRFRTSESPLEHPAVRGGRVYSVGGSSALAFDAATGEIAWSVTARQSFGPSIVLIDDVLYVGDWSEAPTITAMSADDGTELATIPVPFGNAEVVGITNGALIARTFPGLVAVGNPV